MFCIQTHTFYIYSRVSFQAWLPLYSTICSPDRRCRHPADFKLHHTYTVYIYRSKTKRYLYQKSLPDFSRYIPIIGDLPLPRFHGPTPLIFFTMSAMRSAAHTRLEPVGLVDTLDSRRAASSLRSHFTSPSPSARMSPPQQQWRRLPNN